MAAFTFRFDPIDYAKQLRNVGVSQEQADIQAQTIEHVIDDVLQQSKQETKALFDAKELATKGDISLVRGEIRESELRLQKEIETVRSEIKSLEVKLMTIYGSGFIIILGVLAKGFHWF